jgi:hypothetical protein
MILEYGFRLQRVRDVFSYLNLIDFILFDMKLISITMKLTLYIFVDKTTS